MRRKQSRNSNRHPKRVMWVWDARRATSFRLESLEHMHSPRKKMGTK
jgi:hypothetical protein